MSENPYEAPKVPGTIPPQPPRDYSLVVFSVIMFVLWALLVPAVQMSR